MKAAIIYWSKTGNTAKVAEAIQAGLKEAGAEVVYKQLEEAADVDWFDYDLVCIGFPSYQWSPPKPVDEYLEKKFAQYRREGGVKTGAPRMPGKHALIFCTYSGPHTGIDEATPAAKYAGQFFEHLGITVLDEWYVVGEFHGSEERSTMGRLGDIRGRPNEQDLAQVRESAAALVQRIGASFDY
ncbi:MAG: flavodoxin domain-containing protein [Anaerolineae bacterium]|nr:flavodoxin domain-containing protein [Anaerolineae bacterium]